MLDCLIIGDSIAVGTHKFRPDCVAYAQGGITSLGWDRKFGNNDLSAETVIISLGTNDWEKYSTRAKLLEIRNKIKGKRVFWIEPNQESKPQIVEHVHHIAEKFGDVVIPTTRWQTDKIHPSWAGYKNLADKSR